MNFCSLLHSPSVPGEASLKQKFTRWVPRDSRITRQWQCYSISNRKQLEWGEVFEAEPVEGDETAVVPVLGSSKIRGRKGIDVEASTLSTGLMQRIREGTRRGDDEDDVPLGYKMIQG